MEMDTQAGESLRLSGQDSENMRVKFGNAREPYRDAKLGDITSKTLGSMKATMKDGKLFLDGCDLKTQHVTISPPIEIFEHLKEKRGIPVGSALFDFWQENPEMMPRELRGRLLVATGDHFKDPSGALTLFRSMRTHHQTGVLLPGYVVASDKQPEEYSVLYISK